MGVENDARVQFVALTKEEIADMRREAALIGAQAATEQCERIRRKDEKEKADRRLHNTDLLLRNYRTLKDHCQNAVYEKRTETAQDLIEDIMTMKDDKAIVESILRTAQRTEILVEHIDKMLDVYRVYCSKLSDQEKRRYKIIKALYISRQPMTISEISKKFSVSKVTVYDDLKNAKERLSSLFFGIDGLKLF